MTKILITGSAGFIGFHLSKQLLQLGFAVVGVDNLNDYYDVTLKLDRLSQLMNDEQFIFHKLDISDRSAMEQLFEQTKPDIVIHLAAQAGVRYSLENPHAYADSNLVGFLNVLEGCRATSVKHLIYASSSSVYGENSKVPFSTTDAVNQPVSLYAATKRSNELMAYSYSHLYNIPTTGLRFFTVYGPWGRPDMAYFSFTRNILEGKTIKVFNNGQMQRDFTYIDDIIDGITRVIDHVPAVKIPYKLYNIGNSNTVSLNHFIEVLEKCIGIKAIKEFLPMQPGDVPRTYADIDDLKRDTGFTPSTSIEDGLEKFFAWYQSYYLGNNASTAPAPVETARLV